MTIPFTASGPCPPRLVHPDRVMRESPYVATVGEDTGKRDPRRKKNEAEITGTMRLLYAASQGDLDELRAALATGCKPNAADYDGRTALHLAAAEGHLAAARFLLGSGPRQTPPTAGEVCR